MEQYILMNSVTFAIKAQKLLDSRRIRSSIIRDHQINSCFGCGYALQLRVGDQTYRTALEILRQAGIPFRRKGDCP